jgi:hypothetical protein
MHITICQVTLEALPKFHRQMQLMTSLIPIWPQTSTMCQVMPEALPKFHRWRQSMTSLVPIWPPEHPPFFKLRRRRCPNSTGKQY